MYEILMALPLFHGVSRSRISQVIESTKFHFLKFLKGERIITAGDPCMHIRFIISGSVRVTVASPDSRLSVAQTLSAPDVVAPDFLFGRDTRYPCSVVAVDTAGILQIAKSDYIKILHSDQIFLFNFLNMLSMNAQKAVHGVWSVTSGTIEERIAFWISALTQRSGTDITLSCRQRDMCALFGVQRASLVAALDKLKNRGIIGYDQNGINVKSRRDLLDILSEVSDES